MSERREERDTLGMLFKIYVYIIAYLVMGTIFLLHVQRERGLCDRGWCTFIYMCAVFSSGFFEGVVGSGQALGQGGRRNVMDY